MTKSSPKTLSYSFTLMKRNDDIEFVFLDILHHFSKVHFLKSVFTIERSITKGLLHIQGVFSIMSDLSRCGGDGYFRENIKEKLRRIVNTGVGYRLSVTQLDTFGGQHFMYMLGYVTKDHLQKHYKQKLHNVHECDLRDGRAMYEFIQ